MTLSGMTGFARTERSGAYGAVSVEARSVNGKGLDVRLRLPQGLDALENPIRELAKARFTRGSISLNVTLTAPDAAGETSIDQARLQAYVDATAHLVDRGGARAPSVGELLALKGVITSEDAVLSEDQIDARNAAILEAVEAAFDGLKAARLEEGAALKGMLDAHLGEIAELRTQAAACDSAMPQAIKARLQAKLEDLLDGTVDPDRLAQEAAMMAVKADVREELDRLKAHIDSAHGLIDGGSPCGRKLDFLSQEFNREANTLCSKSSDTQLTNIGLALKATVDRLREQVQNVE
ncbi:YicC/YloC family endoribonuclease [Oceanicaulis alexandrii]|uniref:YicC/YloC family endoribonuclease n=1 Tax=Oceanicaulis alexandrii TaxID=153233 RepID=UPI0003B529B9|nr:YicC/YloC family endoribonuclease [Oceanicaulis alexandrii]